MCNGNGKKDFKMPVKDKEYLIQFKWVDMFEPDNLKKVKWQNWKEIIKGKSDKEAFQEAKNEFDKKINWTNRLLGFRVCRIIKEEIR